MSVNERGTKALYGQGAIPLIFPHHFANEKVATNRLLFFKKCTELELIQSHMAQKLVLRGEVVARALRVRSVSREEAWASAGVQGAWVSGCGYEAD